MNFQILHNKFQIGLFLLLLPIAYCLMPSAILATDMNSTNYQLQGGNLNMTSGNKSSTNFKLSDVVGQNASGLFASKGYIIQAGFLNGAAGEIFSFSVNPNMIDFGILIAKTPVEKLVNLKVTIGNSPGYTVRVSQNQPLSTSVGAEIADTTCDSQSQCTQLLASEWKKLESFGFGYNLSGKTVPVDFRTAEYFRPFPSSRKKDQAITIMQTQARKVSDTATMKLKVNISNKQPVGQYRNVLTFLAIAGI